MENKKMPKVLIMMMCKYATERFLSNFDYLDYPRDKIRIVISCRDVFPILKKFFSRRNFEVEIYEDIYKIRGGAHWINPLYEASKLLVEDEDFIINIDDDIIDFPSNLIEELIKADKDIVAPYVYIDLSSYNPPFYDTYCFRTLDRKKFPASPYPPNYDSQKPFELNSVGCIVCIKREVYLNISFIDGISPPTLWLIFCRNARKKNYKVFGLPYLRIYHATGSKMRPSGLHQKYPKVSRKDWKLLWSQKYFPMKIKIKKKIDWRKINCPENFRPCVNCGQCNHVTSSTCRKCGKHPKQDKWGKRF